MSDVLTIRREIERALNSRRAAYRGKLTRWKFKAKGANLVQLEALAGETLQNVECMQQAGFVSGLPAGTQVIALPLGGKTVHTVIIATEYGAYKVQVSEGEVALHHLTEPDNHVWLKNGGIVEVKCATKVVAETPLVELTATTKVKMTTPQVEMTGNLLVAGQIVGQGGMAISGGGGSTISGNLTHSSGNLTSNGKILHTHTHGGVQVGGGNTGAPT